MPRITVAQVLECLGDEFADFAAAFSEGEYLLWLGSGISRDVVPDVPTLLQQMLEFVRSSVDHADPDCRFRKALEEILDVAGVPDATRLVIDTNAPVDTWPAREDIVARLVDKYSDVLNVPVRGEPEDFLLWTGLNVPNTYGDPSIAPDAEHLCIAILMLEGIVTSAPTTNWDGLVEAAVTLLTGDAERFLRVVVRAEDFRESERQADLLKFHGCAIRAAVNEAGYRSRLIARKNQISGWTTKPENQLMKNRLEHLFATRPTLIVGLSAQDADIHTVLHQAGQNLSRSWPVTPPAVVFAERRLHHHHRHVLQVAYGDSYSPNADAVGDSALLGTFAKPALVALVLFTLTEKLCVLVGCVPEVTLSGGELDRVRADIRAFRDVVAGFGDGDPRGFVEAMIAAIALTSTIFRKGLPPVPGDALYQPISMAPVPAALENVDFPGAALGRLALVVSLLSRGLAEGRWTLAMGAAAAAGAGVVRVESPHETSRLFAVRDARSLSHLEVAGVVDLNDGDVVVVQAETARPASTRSPRARYGRTGSSGARLVDFESLCATLSTADTLFEAFRLEGALQ
jgi:hypothetical protein